ncbi:hypothetical protein FNV43_RR18314 [Rhamnella rubrinervis]|uniref:C2H2-type domain-containing protein n=1 Tax=Rhamnella rubrinervis TaxID=2594499 RepID=A0A8K0GW28_9ROSA|nr:hypothetical protein FNV43_RR18314 [Rhamnella rubrinervis]
MEKHKCKLCFKSFSNGRALGGHMRSHMMNLPIPPKPEEEEEEPPPPPIQLSVDAESASFSSSSSDEEGAEDEKLSAYYELRENPKRSIRLVDPEFSFAVDAGSVVLQDRESETESSKNPTRRRSKRTRKSGMLELQYHHHHQKVQEQDEEEEAIIINKIKFNKLISKTESWAEPEPVSSVSDTTTEEDVAFCLMMLSRDKWKKQERQDEEEDHREQEDEAEKSLEDSDESEELKSSRNRTRGKYKCDTCKKVFRSYQALGGHRASHKKIKVSNPAYEPELAQENAGTTSTFRPHKKIHECPVCFRVFSSGQALGGHKRSHVTGSSAALVKSLTKFGDSLIDLNLPAPMDDDEISQIELSAVSDAEFVDPITH